MPYASLVHTDVQLTFFGLMWDGTFAAAICAALVGFATLLVSAVQVRAARIANKNAAAELLQFQKDAERRSHLYTSITSAIHQALSPNLTERSVGLTILGFLLDDPLAKEKDKELILAVGVILET